MFWVDTPFRAEAHSPRAEIMDRLLSPRRYGGETTSTIPHLAQQISSELQVSRFAVRSIPRGAGLVG
jgi:hypothetical protein